MSDFISVKGNVEHIENVRIISEKFRVQSLVIKTADKYPQFITVSLTNEKVDLLDGVKKGSDVTAYINLRGRSFTKGDGSVSYINTLECWKLDAKNVSKTETKKVKESASISPNEDDDDLPF